MNPILKTVGLLLLAGATLPVAAPAGAQQASSQAMSDRDQIEELFIRYYSGLAGRQGFAGFFVDGAELDINGTVVHGLPEILDLYKRVGADKPRLTGTFRMTLNNLIVEVKGDSATAQMLWTQTLNDTIKGPPRFIEQGREYDLLVRQNGQWKIKKRVVIADSGLPDMFDKTWTPRLDYTVADLGAP